MKSVSSKQRYSISAEGKRGFINESGEVVIEPQFLTCGEYSEGLAMVSKEIGQLFSREHSGFIDENGDFVIGPASPPGYRLPSKSCAYSYGNFHEGLAKFWIGDATGYGGFIDRNGNIVIQPEFAEIGDFSEGLACVSLPRSDGSPFGPKLSGFINRNGEFVIPPDREFIGTRFSEGLCVINVTIKSDYSPTVINIKGETVIPPKIYSAIGSFEGGLSRVVKNGRVGCIDTKGDIVIPVEFDQLWEFEKNDLTTAQKDGKWLIIDRKGRTVQEVLYPEAFKLGRLRSGLASIETHNGDGYINEHGSLHIPIKYDSGWEFRGELAMVNFGNFDGYINRQGIMVWKTDRWDGPE